MKLTAEIFLNKYLEKTLIIKSAIDAMDLDIIENTLAEREALIQEWEQSGQILDSVQHLEFIEKIQRFDRSNDTEMLQFREKLKHLESENNRNIQRLGKGKNASDKYNSPYSDTGGSYFDIKR